MAGADGGMGRGAERGGKRAAPKPKSADAERRAFWKPEKKAKEAALSSDDLMLGENILGFFGHGRKENYGGMNLNAFSRYVVNEVPNPDERARLLGAFRAGPFSEQTKNKISSLLDEFKELQSAPAPIPEPAPMKLDALRKERSLITAKSLPRQERAEVRTAPESTGNQAVDRLLGLVQELKAAKGKKRREALTANIEALATNNQAAFEQYFKDMPYAAHAASVAERVAARLRTDKEKVKLVQNLIESFDAERKRRRLSEEEAIKLVSSKVEKLLAKRGAGTLSEFSGKTGANKWSEGGLVVSSVPIAGAETLTAGAYLSLLAQAILHTTVVYSTPAGMAFNVACIVAAASAQPGIELAKSLNFYQKSARSTFYKELKVQEEAASGEQNKKPQKKKLPINRVMFAALAGIAAAGADIAPKVATVAVAQGPNMLSTAAAFNQGEHGREFVAETRAAMTQAREQAGQVITERLGERHDRAAPMPPLVARYHDDIERVTEGIIENEVAGEHSSAGGGSGVATFGPLAARKMGLIDGFLHVPAGTDQTLGMEQGFQWALDQRAHWSYLQVDAEGNPIPLKDADGNPVIENGVPQYERVPIEFERRPDGTEEAVGDWVERRYEIFEAHAQAEFLQSVSKMHDTEGLAAYLADRLTSINIKLDLLQARIQGTEGFSNDTQELQDLYHRIERLFYADFTIPCQGMSESLVESLRQVGSGDAEVRFASPALTMDLSKLDRLEAPPSLTLRDLTSPESVVNLYKNGGNPLGQLIFAGLFGGILLQGVAKNEAGKRRAKKHARTMFIQMKDLFGAESVKQGAEWKTAQSLGEALRSTVAGQEGIFSSQEFKKLGILSPDRSWLHLDPSFILFSMRLAGEKSGELAKADFKEPKTWQRLFAKTYLKGAKEIFHGAAVVPEVQVFSRMRDRYTNTTALTGEVFGEVLPGYASAIRLTDEMRALAASGKDERSPEMQEAATNLKNVYAEMVMGHLIARTRYAKTRIDYFEKAYKDIEKNGKFDDLGVEHLSNLPNLALSFGDVSAKLGEDDVTKMEVVRETGFRSTVIAQIEKDLKLERATLREIGELAKSFENAQDERIAKLTTSFGDRLAELNRELAGETAVNSSGDRLLKDMSARGGLDRMLREQLQGEIQNAVREYQSRAPKGKKAGREYSIQDQYEAVNEVLQQTVHDTDYSNPNSLFINDKRLYKFVCEPKMVLRPIGYKGAIAEYYALAFRVTENGKKDAVFEDELPIRTLFAKEVPPSGVARQVHDWLAEKRSEASVAAKLYAMSAEAARLKRDVVLPQAIPLAGGDAKSRIETLFNTTIPEARIQEALAATEHSMESVRESYDDNRTAADGVIPLTRKRGRTSYVQLLDQLKLDGNSLTRLMRERENPRPAFVDDKKRVQALAEAVQEPELRRVLRSAGLSLDYLPGVTPRNRDVRMTDSRILSRITRLGRTGKSVEVGSDLVLSTLRDPRYQTRAEKKRALMALLKATPAEIAERMAA